MENCLSYPFIAKLCRSYNLGCGFHPLCSVYHLYPLIFLEGETAPVAIRPVSEHPVILCSVGVGGVARTPLTAANSLTNSGDVRRPPRDKW